MTSHMTSHMTTHSSCLSIFEMVSSSIDANCDGLKSLIDSPMAVSIALSLSIGPSVLACDGVEEEGD